MNSYQRFWLPFFKWIALCFLIGAFQEEWWVESFLLGCIGYFIWRVVHDIEYNALNR